MSKLPVIVVSTMMASVEFRARNNSRTFKGSRKSRQSGACSSQGGRGENRNLKEKSARLSAVIFPTMPEAIVQEVSSAS